MDAPIASDCKGNRPANANYYRDSLSHEMVATLKKRLVHHEGMAPMGFNQRRMDRERAVARRAEEEQRRREIGRDVAQRRGRCVGRSRAHGVPGSLLTAASGTPEKYDAGDT